MARAKFAVILILITGLLLGMAVPAAGVDLGAMPMMPPGGFGGGGAPGQEFATYDEVRSTAGILFEDGAVNQENESGAFKGEFSVDPQGEITPEGVSGINLQGEEESNGLAIEMASETDVFTIGGEADLVDGYNSVIQVKAGEGNTNAGYEAVYGVGVGINTGELRVVNSYIRSEGPRSTPIYAFSTQNPAGTSLVVVDSKLEAHSDEIWMPSFKLLAGGARATLLMTRNNSWFYGSEVVSNNWGAISQDTVDAHTYIVNSSGISTEGGYGIYVNHGMVLYGSDLYGGQYGLFLCGNADITTDTGAAAREDADAMSKQPDFEVDTERQSHIAAPFNAIVVHTSIPSYTMKTTAVLKNTLVSTLMEHLPDSVTPMSYDDEYFMPGTDILGSGAGCGATYFYNKNLYGSLVLIRSMNAELTFDNAETYTSNGVLVQSVITYDPPSASGYLTPEQGDEVFGIAANFINGEYEGDVLHQDYQRSMTVTVGQQGTLSGKVVSGTWQAWNDLWSEANLNSMLESDGYSADMFGNEAWVEDVHLNLIRADDSAYDGTENRGVTLTVEQGGVWNVTGDSSLKQLVIAEGGTVQTPEGCTMTVFTGCDSSNNLLFYDETAGTPVEELVPGTYDNVVIRIEGTPVEVEEVPAEAKSSVEASLAEEAGEPEPIQEATPAEDVSEVVEPRTSEAEGGNGTAVVIVVVVIVIVAAAVVIAIRRKKK